MPNRSLTPQQLNSLFCSREFLERFEAFGEHKERLIHEATEEELQRWLAEGTRAGRQILPKREAHSWSGWKGALAGFGAALVAMLSAAALSPTFRSSVGPDTQWLIGGYSFDWPVSILPVLLACGLPAAVAGALLARISIARASFWAGLIGAILGCWWQFQLSLLDAVVAQASAMGEGNLVSVERLDGSWISRWFVNAEYGLLVKGGLPFAIFEILLPLICALAAVLTVNYWVKSWRRGANR